MKHFKLISFITGLICIAQLALAQDLSKRIDELGGNQDLAKKAKALDPDNRVRIVQNRAVDRTWRFEVGINYGNVSGGNPYLNTYALGGALELHINPKFSIGGRYYNYQNELTSEGERAYKAAEASNSVDNPWGKPAVDYPISTSLATASFYPIYGKLNLFDMGVAQFDLYMVGGYGQMKTSSGTSPAWIAGGGVGMWLSQNFSSRIEVRYQNYQDEIYTGSRDEKAIATTFSIGILL